VIIQDELLNNVHYKVLDERYFDCIINDFGQLTSHLSYEQGDNSIGIAYSINSLRLLNSGNAVNRAENMMKIVGMFTKQFKFANYTW